MQKLKSCKN